MDRDEFSTWLRLLETPGVGRGAARALLAHFGSPEAVLSASVGARRSVVPAAIANALAQLPPDFDARRAAAYRWLDGGAAAGEAREVLALGDTRFPQALIESPDPPLLLYLRGRVELLQRPQVAVVGSRNPTPQGVENARAFASHLSHAGWTVTSGLALGIDGAAHEGALEGAGSTVAVVGTGLDIVYPLRHRALASRVAERGLLVSEFAIGTPALAENFPVRNRLIAGLARGTLVVEAAVRSGSLITARLALEAGRDVFAIPGSIHAPQSRGCHALLKQGARLVESGADIIEELGPLTAVGVHMAVSAPSAAAPRPAGARDDPLLEALGFDPITLDELVARTGESAAVLSARLLDLELQGRVSRLPGQSFQRFERA